MKRGMRLAWGLLASAAVAAMTPAGTGMPGIWIKQQPGPLADAVRGTETAAPEERIWRKKRGTKEKKRPVRERKRDRGCSGRTGGRDAYSGCV